MPGLAADGVLGLEANPAGLVVQVQQEVRDVAVDHRVGGAVLVIEEAVDELGQPREAVDRRR
jgi:hypothetical protein